MDEVKKIYSYFSETDKTLVFTSQTAAQNALSAFIINHPSRAVFKDRAQSWDSFYLSLINTEGRKCVSKTARKVFSYSFLKNGGLGRLRYFASPKYPEAILAYSSSIASLLPYFPTDNNPINEHISAQMLHDIRILRTAYSEFLDENGLYERNYLEPDYSKIGRDRFVFVFPSTFTSSRVEEILALNLVDVIQTPENSETPLVEYSNALSEIRWTLRQIEEDRKKYRDDEIAISSSSLPTYRPYLESEAKKRDIPLVFTSARPLADYPEGRFLHQIYSTVMSSFSFDETKKLILNPQFPFKNREKMVAFFRLGIENKMEDFEIRNWQKILSDDKRKIFRNLSKDEKELFREILEDEGMHFRKLLEALKNIVTSKRSSLTLAHIQNLRDTFFDEGAWNEDDDRVFGSALQILREIGDEEIPDLYKLFLSLLDETQYVERTDDRKGIRVYAYPASSGLITPVHYVIGLDDRTTCIKVDDYPFIVSLSRPEAKDASVTILSTYRCPVFTEKLVLSGTTEGFDGARLIPPVFLDSSIRKTGEITDEYREERSLWMEGRLPKGKPYISQSNGYLKAVKTSLRGRKGDVLVTPFTEDSISITVSNMKNFDLCPYRGYASTRLQLRDRDYEPKIEDARVVGEILHETVETALTRAGTIAEIDIEEMQRDFLLKLDEKERSHEIPTKYAYAHIYGKYCNKLEGIKTSAKASIYDSFSLDATEKETEEVPLTGNITMKGRADTILVNTETGDAYIIDWKTNGTDDYDANDLEATSLQVILYAVLFEKDNSYSVRGGAFYSFNYKKYGVVWPSEQYMDGTGKLKMEGFSEDAVKISIRDRLERIKSALERGRFTPEYTEENCKYCPYPRLCRAKFVASKEEDND